MKFWSLYIFYKYLFATTYVKQIIVIIVLEQTKISQMTQYQLQENRKEYILLFFVVNQSFRINLETKWKNRNK